MNALEFYFEYIEETFDMGFDTKGTIAAQGTRDKNDIPKNKEILEKVNEIGKSI